MTGAQCPFAVLLRPLSLDSSMGDAAAPGSDDPFGQMLMRRLKKLKKKLLHVRLRPQRSSPRPPPERARFRRSRPSRRRAERARS